MFKCKYRGCFLKPRIQGYSKDEPHDVQKSSVH